MSESTDILPPPPSYEEAQGYMSPGMSASDPLLSHNINSAGSGHSNRPLAPGSQDISEDLDSPHSSDDEETARLKADLRKLREEKKRLLEDERQEQKKKLLRMALEREQNELRAASGQISGTSASSGITQPTSASCYIPPPFTTPAPTAPIQPQYYPGPGSSGAGSVIHPTVTFNPNQRTSLQMSSSTGAVAGPSGTTNTGNEENAEKEVGSSMKCCYIFILVLGVIALAVLVFVFN